LRRRILFDALLHDLALFTRRRRYLPHRRRRRWTPVLLLDATDPLAAELVELYAELTRTMTVMPLLLLASLDDAATTVNTLIVDVDEAAPILRSLVDKEEADPPRRLGLRLPKDPAPDPIAKNYLSTHRRVTPRVPGHVSAWTPLVCTLALIATLGGFVLYQHLVPGGCADTKINSLGERVGVIESGCSFGQPAPSPGVPSLSDLEREVFENDAAVDQLRGADNEKRYYREVVFFGPLTRPNTAERTAPPNAIWQLRGAVDAQRVHNDDATRDANRVPIKIILANSGDRFVDGDWVASKIAGRPQSDNGGLAAVIGISQSRRVASDAIRNHLKDIPVIGASMYGSQMTENKNMFLSAPLNKAFAGTMAEWLKKEGYGSRSTVVFDPDDEYYSRELRDQLHKQGIGSNETDIEIKEGDSADGIDRQIAEMCGSAEPQIPVLANRADQILKFLDRAKNIDACTRNPMQVLAGPGVIVEAATGTLHTRYSWARLTITSLAKTAEESERSTGRDAFGIAAIAIDQAQISAKGVWKPALVQNMLGKTEIFQPHGLPKPNDDTSMNRIQMVNIS
jgi:hypothetical protein